MGASTAEPASPGGLSSDQLTAFVAELASKSDLVWVSAGEQPARALWHVWHDDAVTVVAGGLEQPDPGLVPGSPVVLTLRSRDNRSRQLTVMAAVARLDAGTPAWDDAVKALHPKRLNAPDGEDQPQRWARESTVWTLRPTSEVVEQPGEMSSESHRAEPAATPATTLTRTPFHAGRATKKRR